ncbi:replication initiation factor domain-containing protein [Variovorax boronicumulans]|uniref:replication initiation factor domain-containing protein n=2 Tax=Variovorax boronicumulans TaxID=436515 RepID=UPI0009F6DB26|nr:replication initiation factor domain-containing protein [Variovorax boronicumulans]
MTFSDSFGPLSDGASSGADAEGERASADRRTAPAPRVVTTGRKNGKTLSVDMDSGDLVELLADRRGFHAVLHPPTVDTVPPGAALIDAVAFTIVPPDERSYTWVLDELRQFMVLETIEPRRGMFGFRYSARIGDSAGVIAWGGESQRGRVYVSLMGKGCSMVNDWPGLAGWLEQHRATLKRADAAYDDFDGQMVSIAWAEAQYRGDGFNAGGRKPAHQTIGDWLDGDLSVKGRTLGIGNRASGKYCRIYEKGKQLGDPTSAWSRVEVEWRDQDRHIPYDILTRPGHYLAGAYPCLAFLNIEQSKIRTISKGAQIAFERAIENARQHCGKLVNLALDVFQGDYAEVVQRLIRPGYPGRVDPFSYHVSRSPSMLDSSLVGVA